MRGIAVFVGGPLDEQVRELPPIAQSYGILEYKRTRVRYGPHPGAVYELDL